MIGGQIKKRILGTRAGLACVLGVALMSGGSPLAAQTIDLAFYPPNIPAVQVCEADTDRVGAADRWAGWDGTALPDMPLRQIRRDIATLRAADPVAWFDTVWQAVALLDAHAPSITDEAILLNQIATLEAAGRFQELVAGGYVLTLARQAPVLTISTKMQLSRLLRNGIGIDADPAWADALLVEAGYAGELKALFELAERQLDGTAPADWAIPLELTLTTAFSTTIGELDTAICDRAKTIARAYRSGRLVTANPELAEAWFRFAADLGDATAAWRVAEFHMAAEGIDKDNDTLLAYLEKAATGGLSYAIVELARVYEAGALAPKDIDRAAALMAGLAETGDMQGLMQRALFLRRQVAHDPSFQEALHEAVKSLSEHPQAPAWAFRDLAYAHLEKAGFWAGQDQARALFQKAADMGDTEARIQLAKLSLTQDPTLADVDAAIDTFDRVFPRRGGAAPVKEVIAALVCRAPGFVDEGMARSWLDRFDEINGLPAEMQASSVLALDPALHPMQIAAIQSEALHGTPTGIAEWRRITAAQILTGGGDASEWQPDQTDTDEMFIAQIMVDFALSPSQEDRAARLAALRARHQAVGPDFARHITVRLFKDAYGPDAMAQLSPQDRQTALDTLHASAAAGYGRAMMALAAQEALRPAQRALYNRYKGAIADRGDYAAQVFAARLSDAPERYVARAMGTMPCDFRSTMEMLALAEHLKDAEGVDRWLQAAGVLADDRASRLKQMAHAVLRVEAPNAATDAVAYLQRASQKGDDDAAEDLFRLVLRPETAAYDPEGGVLLLAQAVTGGRLALLPGYLAALADADQSVRTVFEDRLDMDAVVGVAADSGHPAAMRLYALRLRDGAGNAAALGQSVAWLERAAGAGDTPAMVELGQMLAFGIGVTADRSAALRWLEEAAATGSPRAAEIMRLVRLSGGS